MKKLSVRRYFGTENRLYEEKIWLIVPRRGFGANGDLNEERVRLIWLIALCRTSPLMQAPRFECLSFDPFPLLYNGLITCFTMALSRPK